MFWAVTCEAGKRYCQKPKESFCITMAALEPRDTLPENKQVSMMLEHGGKEFLLCTLEYDRVMQVSMNLKFSEGETAYFFVSGEGTIHLSGYLEQDSANEKTDDSYNQPSTSGMAVGNEESDLDDDDDDDDDSEEDDGSENDKKDVGVDVLLTQIADSDDDDSDYDPSSDLQQKGLLKKLAKTDNKIVCLNVDDDEDVDEDDDDDEEEEEDDDDMEGDDSDSSLKVGEFSAGASTSKKRKKNLVAIDMKRLKQGKKSSVGAMKKACGENSVENESSDSDNEDVDDDDMESSIGHTPMPKKMMGILKNGNQSSSKSFSSPSLKSNDKGKKPLVKAVQEKSQKYSHTLSSGVEYEDIRVGNGPMAKNGKILHVYYIGKLEDGKVFDSVREGKNKPFTFRLGKNDVISGWDEGLIGMRTGGKRKLKIPPKMGYGNKKMPGIPQNSTLYFTVELKAVN